ncbi:MAG: hypothetical protein FJW79_04045 [Actinobacteria bacterium]|nr:hypothetical protein [Actinomycetota bacterium]
MWGIPWSSLWPPEGATATYRLSVWNQEPLDLPATIEYGMEWQDGTWDRIQIGSSEPGELGLAFYFDRSEPWAIRVWGVRVTAPGLGENGFMDEYLDGFPAVDLSGLPDTAPTLDVDAFVDTGRDDIFGPSPAIYAMEVVGLEEITVAAGTFPVTLHVRFGLGGEFFGLEPGQEINSFSDLWLDPTQLILRWDPSPGLGTPLELVSPWE